MKPGISLLELIIALLISSLLLNALYVSFIQTIRSISVADDYSMLDTTAAIFYNQLQKDLEGIFILDQADAKITPIDSQEKKEKSDKATQEKQEKEKAATTKQEKKPEEKPFASTNKDKHLEQLTFISNNPLRIYEYAANTQIKPKAVRVTYKLEQEKNTKRFVLFRQEEMLGTKKDEKKKEQAEGYVITSHIKTLECEYTQVVLDKDGIPVEKVIKEWKPDVIAKEQALTLPKLIKISVTFVDNEERERSYIFYFTIPIFEAILQQAKKPKPISPSTAEKEKKGKEAKEQQQKKKQDAAQKNEKAKQPNSKPQLTLKDFNMLLTGKS